MHSIRGDKLSGGRTGRYLKQEELAVVGKYYHTRISVRVDHLKMILQFV